MLLQCLKFISNHNYTQIYIHVPNILETYGREVVRPKIKINKIEEKKFDHEWEKSEFKLDLNIDKSLEL